jgi:hypothetical protein
MGLHIDLDKEIEDLEEKTEETEAPVAETLKDPLTEGTGKAMDEALKHGLKTGTECLITIDSSTGQKAIPTEGGSESQVQLTPQMIQLFRLAPDQSLVTVHNHPSSSSFSDSDLNIMAKFRSIKEMAVIGHDGTKYYVSVGSGKRVTYDTIYRVHKASVQQLMPDYQGRVIRGEISSKEAWREHSHRAMELTAKHFGWDYRRELPNETQP